VRRAAAAALAVLAIPPEGAPPGGPAGRPVELVRPADDARLDRGVPPPEPPYGAAGIPAPFAADVSYAGERCGTGTVREVTGAGPITLAIEGESALGSHGSTGEPVSLDVLTFEGGGGQRKESIPMSASYEVPDGEFGRLVAHPLYDVYTYRTSGDGPHRVPGVAAVPAGYCYRATAS
jgi:hypothetical protein